MPYLTPNDASHAVEVSILLPQEFIHIVRGQLLGLSRVSTWEEYGTLTPEDCASIMQEAFEGMTFDEGLRRGLLAWYDLDDTSGSRADSLGANNLTDNNTVPSTTGKIGNAASFTRADGDYLSHVDNALFSRGNTDFTYVCWVALRNKTTTQRIAGKFNTVGNQRETLLQYNQTTDRFNFVLSNDGTAVNTIAANNFGSPAINTLYMLAGWHDSVNDELCLSVNAGNPNRTPHTTGVFDSSAPFTISNPSNGLDGSVDLFGIWSRVLSRDEISDLYNSGLGLAYSNLIA